MKALVLTAMVGSPLFSGEFTSDAWLTRFNVFRPAPWTEGIERTSVQHDAEAGKKVLEVRYPKSRFGNDKTGVQWKTYLDKGYEALVVSYRVRFAEGFDFVRGGKLPGLVGGQVEGRPDSVVSGGRKPNGLDGWSARIMWRRRGEVVQYVYHPDQPTAYGEDLPWTVLGTQTKVKFVPGKWHAVKTEVRMNTPGKHDGVVRSWFDGELALERKDLRFRDVPGIQIDALYFSTFFGGDDQSWAAVRDETVRFDDFKIERAPGP